jgi:hypothetical protein
LEQLIRVEGVAKGRKFELSLCYGKDTYMPMVWVGVVAWMIASERGTRGEPVSVFIEL